MSILNEVKEYFGFGKREEGDLTPMRTPTLEERENGAAADRGYALGMVKDAMEALKDAAKEEESIARERFRRAEQGKAVAKEQAERIVREAEDRARTHVHRGLKSEKNQRDDEYAVEYLQRILSLEVDASEA